MYAVLYEHERALRFVEPHNVVGRSRGPHSYGVDRTMERFRSLIQDPHLL